MSIESEESVVGNTGFAVSGSVGGGSWTSVELDDFGCLAALEPMLISSRSEFRSPNSSSDSNAVSGGPASGILPSRKALAISAAFHFAYLIFSLA